MEKKEHMISDEVNSNNDLINDHSDNFLSVLQNWCKKIKDILGYEISVEATSSPVSAKAETRQEEQTFVGEDVYNTEVVTDEVENLEATDAQVEVQE